MKSLINYFIKYPIAANLLMISLFILGVISMFTMQSTFFPEAKSRLISIRIVYPGASPEEIEEGVINKIEENLKGVTGVERITSTSSENSGSISVEVFKGYDTDVVLQDVKNAVDQISSYPVDMEPPIIYKLENLIPAISFAISGDVSLNTLKKFARQAEDDLLAMDGISKVELSGFPDEEIEIAFREKDLRNYNLTFLQATQAIRAANLEITGGTIKGKDEELLVRAKNKSYYAQGLRDIVVKQIPGESVILLHQIADIQDKWVDNPNRSFVNEDPAVVVSVSNTLEEDLLSIADLVKEYVDEFNSENSTLTASVINDQSEVLNDRIGLLTENGVLGFTIVLILLAMFLHWRLAFWVALAIPISFAGMFIMANALDITINVISLFGMILVIGILVDDGIVIGENIYKMHEKGVPRLQAALKGTMQVLPAVFSAIITTIVAFSSFFFIDGRLGDFFREMAVVVIFSLVFSLVEGALILPTHVAHSKALDEKAKKNQVQLFFERVLNWMKNRLYAPVLRFAMANKLFTVAFMVSLLILTFGAISGGYIKTTFFPNIERDEINVSLQMPAGTRENITQDWLEHIRAAAWRANEQLSQQYYDNEKQAITQIETRLGPSTYQGSLNIQLLNGEERDSLRLREVSNLIRKETGPIIQAESVSFGSRSVFGKPISIAVTGSDNEQLAVAAERIKDELNNLEELTDVIDDNQLGLREINVSLKEKALFLGLNLQEIVAQVRQGFFGSEVQRLQRGRDEVRVWVRYDEKDRSDLTDLQDMRIRFQDGREFPLSEIANLEIERGVININHIDGKRAILVEADIAKDDVSVSDVTTNLQDEILPNILADYPGVNAQFEGQFREQAKSASSIQLTGSIVLGLMFLIIALTFRSIGQTIAVFLLIPFGLIGVGWGHFMMGMPISLFSILGLIALIGILVNDALVMVSTYNDLLEEGKPQMDALFEASTSRFRPILLTSVTTFAGLAPLLYEKSLQAQFLIPMAISVSFGLLAVTVIILILLPVLLIVVNRFKVYASYLWMAEKPSYESVEPGVVGGSGYQYIWSLLFGLVGFVFFMLFLLQSCN